MRSVAFTTRRQHHASSLLLRATPHRHRLGVATAVCCCSCSASASASSLFAPTRTLRQKKASWTSLLDDDDQAQRGNLSKFDEKVEGKMKKFIEAEMPPQLRGPNVNDEAYAKTRDGQVKQQFAAPDLQQESKEDIDADVADAMGGFFTSSAGSAARKRREQQQQQQLEQQRRQQRTGRAAAAPLPGREGEDAEKQNRQQHPSRPPSAMSRFFKQQQEREFASKRYEDEDKSRFGIPMPSMQRDPDGDNVSIKSAADMAAAARANEQETPYDAYRSVASGAKATDSEFQVSEKSYAAQSVVPGLGLVLDSIRHAAETQSDAAEKARAAYRIRRPQVHDSTVALHRRVLADIDIYNPLQIMSVISRYTFGEIWLALLSALTIFLLTEYQYRHRFLEKYDEFLGLDTRRGGEVTEYAAVLCIAMFVYRAFLFRPMMVSVLTAIRVTRHLMGRPLGP